MAGKSACRSLPHFPWKVSSPSISPMFLEWLGAPSALIVIHVMFLSDAWRCCSQCVHLTVRIAFFHFVAPWEAVSLDPSKWLGVFASLSDCLIFLRSCAISGCNHGALLACGFDQGIHCSVASSIDFLSLDTTWSVSIRVHGSGWVGILRRC